MQILSTSRFSRFPTRFDAALRRARNLNRAQEIVSEHGLNLWQQATSRAQATTGQNADDRPLYWARLQMTQTLRQWRPAFALGDSDRQALVRLLEQRARGMTSTTFSGAAGVKKILISGFDPFGLDNSTTIKNSNPSGAVAISLDGATISNGTLMGEIQSVVFPVRFDDFNAGLVESFFGPYLTGTNAVDMIMTISQHSAADFEVEQFAGRRRNAALPDNLNLPGATAATGSVVPPGLAAGPEFIETSLPTACIRGALGRPTLLGETEITETPAGGTAPVAQTTGPTAGSTAVRGSSGSFLSNEIFYRTSLLRTQSRPTLPVGHLHIPRLAPPATGVTDAQFEVARTQIVNQVKAILEATLPAL